ncbi:mechanosensitive ion channel family protein [Candidatus Bathyarchaeota archaeon]|nr:mechanosensitive ion channel family protein [Candidatus Bathyarchaeota archaeon]
MFEFLDIPTPVGLSLGQALYIVVIAVAAFVLERIVTRYLRRFGRRAHLAPSVCNNLVLTFRLLILIGAAVLVIRVGGLPTEWFVAFSALGGAAIGLASTQTIGNFVAGLYLLAARPFKVGDYVRLGAVEGIVQEITINYTKVLTIGNNVVSVANLQILQRDITNCLYEDEGEKSVYCCTFEMGFDHTVSTEKMAQIFSEVFERHRHKMPRPPSFMLLRSGGFERVYMVYLYVEHPEDIFILRPIIAEEVFKRRDQERSNFKP